MSSPKPIRRHPGLQPISREHHQGLLLCWKIRTGLSKGIAPERIKKYIYWFYQEYLIPHFRIEEEYIFPILGNDHELVQKVIAQHRSLEQLFESDQSDMENLKAIEQELENHIRFEERVLFNEIQEKATFTELNKINEVHVEAPFEENTDDVFWK